MSTVKPIPEKYHRVTPYIVVKNAAEAIQYYKNIFGAVENMRIERPDGKVGHAEIKIGDSTIMLCDECPEMGGYAPKSDQGSFSLCLYVEDVDTTIKHAVDAGASVKMPVQNQFYGDRSGSIVDPFGHIWHIATQVEAVSPEELQKRMDNMMKQKSKETS